MEHAPGRNALIDRLLAADAAQAQRRQATPMTFYLGTHRPIWLSRANVPLFVSANTLSRYRTSGDLWPTRKAERFGSGVWALDSGAFTALTSTNDDHPWHLPASEYGGMVTRFTEEIGAAPRFAAPQDWPCEAKVLERTGMTVRDHQQLTVENFIYLRTEFGHVPWAPVLQGWTLDDYLYCVELYESAGVNLKAEATVGVGSVCRSNLSEVPRVVEILQTLAGMGLRLHGFGVNIAALRQVGHLLASSDSMAWSDTARKEMVCLPECITNDRHGGTDPGLARRGAGEPLGPCSGCLTYALQWRERVLAAVDQSRTTAERSAARPHLELLAA